MILRHVEQMYKPNGHTYLADQLQATFEIVTARSNELEAAKLHHITEQATLTADSPINQLYLEFLLSRERLLHLLYTMALQRHAQLRTAVFLIGNWAAAPDLAAFPDDLRSSTADIYAGRTRSALMVVNSIGVVDDRKIAACLDTYNRILNSGALTRTGQNGTIDRISLTQRLQIVVFAIRTDVLQPTALQSDDGYRDQYLSSLFLHRSHVYQSQPGLTEITIQAGLFRTALSHQVVPITICIDSQMFEKTSKDMA